MPRTQRLPEIDALKAAAILTVVFIHSLRAHWDPGYRYSERLLAEAARFAVPAFLATSGFLYFSSRPIPGSEILRRLRRILVPYFVVSLAALAFVRLYPAYAQATSPLASLLLGNTFGPFYYVFLLTEFVVATYFLSRMPRSWTLPVLTLCGGAAIVPFLWFAEGVELSLWTLRLPLLFACWFMLGWSAACYEHRVRQLTETHRVAILAIWFSVVGVWLLLDVGEVLPARLSRASSLLHIAANIIGLYTCFRWLGDAPAAVVALSERTYAIYLLHLFFVYAVLDAFGASRHSEVYTATACAWVAGIVGSLGLIQLVYRLAPRYSRDLIGYGPSTDPSRI